jgi:type IV pilus assembly protein PilF
MIGAGWRRRLAALFGAAWLLAGCATPPPPQQDIRTASDMTSADRLARVRLELASGYFSRGQNETALDEVKQAIAARPDLAEAYSLRGLIYASMGELTLAEQSFERGLQLNPRDADAMHNYGWFLCQQRRFADADQQFDRALAVPQYRDVPRSLLAKGVCQARDQRWAEAEKTLTRSYEMDPANPATSYSLGEVLVQLREYERARFYLRRVNAQPATSNAQSLWLAARIEHELGNPAGARDLGEQLQRRYPRSPEAGKFDRGQWND